MPEFASLRNRHKIQISNAAIPFGFLLKRDYESKHHDIAWEALMMERKLGSASSPHDVTA
jgi:hypothetical protein